MCECMITTWPQARIERFICHSVCCSATVKSICAHYGRRSNAELVDILLHGTAMHNCPSEYTWICGCARTRVSPAIFYAFDNSKSFVEPFGAHAATASEWGMIELLNNTNTLTQSIGHRWHIREVDRKLGEMNNSYGLHNIKRSYNVQRFHKQMNDEEMWKRECARAYRRIFFDLG